MGAALGQRIAEGNGMSAMTTEQKIIKAKIGLLELAKQLGNVSQACKVMGYSRDSFYRFKGALRQGRRPGAGRDEPAQADPCQPRGAGDRKGSRGAHLGSGSGLERAEKRGLSISPFGVRSV